MITFPVAVIRETLIIRPI